MVAALMLSVVATQAQTLNSGYFTQDYKYRHSMNPAFDNEQGYCAIPVIGNLYVSAQSNFGYDAVVMKNPEAGVNGQKNMATFLHPAINAETALGGFNKGDNRLQANINIAIVSVGFRAFGGYNTLEINSKTQVNTVLPYELFEFAKNTGNRRYEIGDISAQAMSYVEVGFGHSHQINDNLRIGAKLKALIGGARADVKLENMTADLSADDKWIVSGKATADVSLKGFEFKEKTKEYKNRPGSYNYVNDADVSNGGVGGFGFAVDLGGVYKLNDDWQFSAALLDLGFINWTNDIQAVNASQQFEFGGFHDTEISKSSPNSFKNQGNSYSDQIAEFANLRNQGDKGSRSTALGSTLNVGAEYTLPVYRNISFGVLSSTRFQKEFTWTEGRLSANWTPLNWLDGGVNFAVSTFTVSGGWILNIHPGGFNLFLGMDHIMGKTSKEGIPLSGNGSVNFGMNIAW